MVIMTVFSASVFARNGFENYSGLSVGFGFSNAKYTTQEDVNHEKSCNPLDITVTDYAFFDRSPVGAYVDVGISIPLNFKRDGAQNDNWVAGVYVAFGPAFKFDVGGKVSLLVAAGFNFYSTSKEATYPGLYYKLDRMYFGAGAEVQASYRIGSHFAINLGASAAYYFANYSSMKHRYYDPINVSYTSYSEFKVVPKLSGYYVY